MSFDALVVGFGMSRVLIELRLAPSPAAYSVLAAVVVIDAYLLYRFFQRRSSPSRTGGQSGLRVRRL